MKSQGEYRTGMVHVIFEPVCTAASINIMVQYAPAYQARKQLGKLVVKSSKRVPDKI